MEQHANRITYLDAVRGLAAISVLVAHVIASHWHWMTEAKVALMVFNGNDAVSIFFVLSGLVLSHKAFREETAITTDYYKRFAVARVFRLYPAFLVMLVIYYLYLHRTEGFFDLWKQTLLHNPHFFWEEAMLVRGQHNHFFPDWTLGVEVAMSLLVPFLIIIARQSSKLLVFLMMASFFAGWGYVSQFILHFGLGVLIAKYFTQIHEYNNSERWWYRHRLPLFLFLLLGYMVVHYIITYNPPKLISYLFDSILQMNDYTISAFISATIIVYVINSQRLRRIFSLPLFTFLGKVSYGVYLSHWFFTVFAMNNFEMLKARFSGGNELVFFVQYMVATLICSVLTGLLLYHLVELPFIKFGKRLASRLGKSGETTSEAAI